MLSWFHRIATATCCLYILALFLLATQASSNSADKKLHFFAHQEHQEASVIWAVGLMDPGSEMVAVEPGCLKIYARHLWSASDPIAEHICRAQKSGSLTDRQVREIADELGLVTVGGIEELPGIHLFGLDLNPLARAGNHGSVLLGDLYDAHRRHVRKDADQVAMETARIEDKLRHHRNVKFFFSQPFLRRQQRKGSGHTYDEFSDPVLRKQWHLMNWLNPDMDINITGVWDRNVTGTGITVAIVDDGVEWTNPDLHGNYNPEGSWDLNDNDPDPMPNDDKASNHHGTRCAGEIAAVANSVCAVGVAYKAKFSGIRILDGPLTDSLEARAFTKGYKVNDVYSCSWGPDDDGKTVDGPHLLAQNGMSFGINYGRRGYGSIYVVASGNGGRFGDNCNYDGYANSVYTVTVGAVDETGHMPKYAEECASMLAVTFSSGTQFGRRSIVTTDWTKHDGTGCTENHTGTSAAAPIAAGMIALMLQVRPCLTWRDVQYILALTAVKVDVDVADWSRNGAGLWHSHKHGFGLLKTWRLVNAAKVWEMVPWMSMFMWEGSHDSHVIPKYNTNENPRYLRLTHTVSSKDIYGFDLFTLEYVQVKVTISHVRRGSLEIRLTCPSGTESVIGAARPHDNSSFGFQEWVFSTVRCWGESPVGTYSLTVRDLGNEKDSGHLTFWALKLYGSPMLPEQLQEKIRHIESAMSGEHLHDNYNLPCPAPPNTGEPDRTMSIKTLKIVILMGIFCLVLSIYQTLEYCLCYKDEKRKTKQALGTHASQELRPLALSPGGQQLCEETQALLCAEEDEEVTENGVISCVSGDQELALDEGDRANNVSTDCR